MRLYLSSAATVLSLLLMAPSSSEAKLGAPRRRHEDQHQHRKHLPQNIRIPIGGPHPHRPHRRSLESSCYEHPGQFRYQTQTNGSILISCSRLVLQMARGAVSATKMSNKCRQPLVGDYRYGPGSTVADACPALCGRPCDDQDDTTDGDGGDVIRLPENDSNEDEIIEDEVVIELIDPNPIVDANDEEPVHEEQPTPDEEESPSIIETIQSQVQEELTESEDEEYGDKTPTIDLIAESESDENDQEEDELDTQIDRPTPTIATFGKFVFRNFIICQRALSNCSLASLSCRRIQCTLQNQSNVETANGEMSLIWN